MKVNVGISSKHLTMLADILSSVLSDAMVLYVKTRKFHWNVSGESFMELHKLFEHQYSELEEAIDAVAERINKLGSKTIGTMQEFIERATLKEGAGKYPTQKEMLKELLVDHETVIIQLRKHVETCDEQCKDVATADFLTDLIKSHETIAWTLRRYLE